MVRQTYALCHCIGLCVARTFRTCRAPKPKATFLSGKNSQRQVVLHAQIWKHTGDLVRTHQTLTRTLVQCILGNVMAIKHNASRICLHGTRDVMDQCGLACAIRSNQCMDLTGLNGQVGLVQCRQTTKTFGKPIYKKQRCCHANGSFLKCLNTLVKPLGARRTTANKSAPNPSCQWIVKWLSVSSSNKNTIAPQTPP